MKIFSGYKIQICRERLSIFADIIGKKYLFSKNFDSFYLFVHALILTCTINF